MAGVPKWKRWLSYLTEVPIESRPSEYSEELYVSLVRGRYQLYTTNAIYSFGDLYSNFREAFQQVDLDQRSIDRVLVLGFGLASIPYMLENTFGKKYHYIGVDIDEEVLDLAHQYVLSDLTSTFELICGDASTFVASCAEQFDLIAVDLFIDNLIPDRFETIEFLDALHQVLAPQGLLLLNRLADTTDARDKTERFYRERFRPRFSNTRHFEVEENWILVGEK